MPTHEIEVFFVGTENDPDQGELFLARDLAQIRQEQIGTKKVRVVRQIVKIDPHQSTLAVPSHDEFREMTGIKVESELDAAYAEYKSHFRANDAQFDGWWKANKSRFIVDASGAMEALRRMIES